MKKRYNNLSLFRIIATILVLQFHIFFICYSTNVVESVYLSKFLQGLTALSGFLFSQQLITDVEGFYLRRLKKIIPPVILVTVVLLLWNTLFMIFTNQYDFYIAFTSTRAYNGSLLIQVGNFYYLGYILLCYLITPLLNKNGFVRVVLLIVAFTIETVCGKWMDPLYVVSSFIGGYIIGSIGFKHYVETKYDKSDIIRFVVIAIVVGLSLFFAIYLNDHKLFKGMSRLIKNAFLSLFGFSIFFLFILFTKWMNRFEIKYFEITDSLSFYIFLFNQAFMVGATNVANYVNGYAAKTIIVYLFVLAFSIGLYFASKYLFPKIPFLNDNNKKVDNISE